MPCTHSSTPSDITEITARFTCSDDMLLRCTNDELGEMLRHWIAAKRSLRLATDALDAHHDGCSNDVELMNALFEITAEYAVLKVRRKA